MKGILVWIVISIPVSGLAQNYRIEIGLKASWLMIDKGSADDYNLRSTHGTDVPMPTGEFYYFIRPKVGIGAFYSGIVNESMGEGYAEGMYYDVIRRQDYGVAGRSRYQHYGVALQLSTNREKRFSIYGTAGVLLAEQVIDFGGFKTAKSGMAYSAGIGAVIRITRSIAINLFDIRVILYDKKFGYEPPVKPYGFKADAGLVFKMFREK